MNNEEKQKKYMEIKKMVIQLMDIVTSKPEEVIKNHLKKEIKQINKDLRDEDKISTKDILTEYTEGRGRNCMHFAAGRGDPAIV